MARGMVRHGKHLLREGVRPAGFRKSARHLGKAERRQDGNESVQGEGNDGTRPGGLEGHPGNDQDAAPYDRTHADAGSAQEADRTFRFFVLHTGTLPAPYSIRACAIHSSAGWALQERPSGGHL
jgi:hypothetical protein